MDRYSDTVFITKANLETNLKLNYAWNHISEHPTMANDNILINKKESFQQYVTFC